MQSIEVSSDMSQAARSQERVAAVVEFLATMKHRDGTVAEVAHDARNMVTALSLYCDLLAEPGVLRQGYAHYASELRIVAAASRRLVEKLMLIDSGEGICAGPVLPPPLLPQNQLPAGPTSQAGSVPEAPIDNLQKELLANRNLLDALTGPGIQLCVRTEGGARPVQLSRADLTRVLMNLVKNAAHAMRSKGLIEMTLREVPDLKGEAASVVLLIEDSGPGIPEALLETIFESGYTTQDESSEHPQDGSWTVTHHGLGLAITRSLIEAAGGTIRAANRSEGGARFTLELPVRTD